MKNKYALLVFGLGTLLVAALFLVALRAPREFVLTASFGVMNTQASYTLYGPDEAALRRAGEAVKQAFRETEAHCNAFNPASELARLNRTAATAPFPLSPYLCEILQAAQEAYAFSGGAFDVTARPLMKCWGFHRARATLPSQTEVEDARRHIGFNRVQLDPAQARIALPDSAFSLDLGGIAKGFALDRASKAVRDCGVSSGVIDLGGNLCLLDPRTGTEGYPVNLRDPFDPKKSAGQLTLHNCVISTSGNYERYVIINGTQYAHIMNPRTGRPVSGILAVCVITDSGVRADALSTAVFVDSALAGKAVRTYPNTRVRLFMPDPANDSAYITHDFQ